MHNLRLLDLRLPADLRQAIAAIESYPERVAAVAVKSTWLTVHAAALPFAAAILLKQELLSLDADCVISPSVYLGDRVAHTDALIFGSIRQLRQLAERLRPFPLDDLRALSEALHRLLDTLAASSRGSLAVRGRTFVWGERTLVMGILNATPDSFSGDGLLGEAEQAEGCALAVAQAQTFVAAGADFLDIGGESTRPGALPVAADAEQARIVPVIVGVRAVLDVPISVDTWKAPVAAAALDAGADLVNDVWGLRLPDGGWNDDLARLVAERGVPLVVMHNRRGRVAAAGEHYDETTYTDVMGELLADLQASVAFAHQHGIRREQLIIDPGIGFGKTPTQNLVVLRRLRELTTLGLPILLGTSRKSFIGLALGLPPHERMEGTAATVALGIERGADIVRVHDVAPLVRVARMTDAVLRVTNDFSAS